MEDMWDNEDHEEEVMEEVYVIFYALSDLLLNRDLLMNISMMDKLAMLEQMGLEQECKEAMCEMYMDSFNKFLQTHDFDPKYVDRVYTTDVESMDTLRHVMFLIRRILIEENPEQYVETLTYAESS